ncbi:MULTISPECIES: TetR/AcrR family transcriptional regulator [Kitasatospora]|uniref:Putative TetR family transcriptional regulator n=1 Tax=Kitasatospora setae (strain ATCC 33774 / DSM 43861 / JCM 3304 / KCC A-0304 / NBRC 14216 / KM-6054) TaxID=452652 RepID=E4NGE9_KITSK|nr:MULTISPECIES: TetR/AcrR family transcriptional regulator [Kitasatospora]BAJ30579.1 putative TetR family transcriptional regulator [Kitasatospora setae KM-6054]
MSDEGRPPLRERLVDAGVELVLAEGSGAVGLREIARRAGVSHGAPRRYFATHRELLSAVARRGFEELAGRFAAVRGTDPRERVAGAARVYLAFAAERRGMFELMFRHDLLSGDGAEPAGPPLREATGPLFEGLARLVAECTGDGARAPLVTAALWANLHGLAQLRAWESTALVLGEGREEELLEAVLAAHLGPAAA